jgi:hypothetical protein
LRAAEFLIETADRCIRIANTGRRLADELDTIVATAAKDECSQLIAEGRALANELEAFGQEMLAKAVELDTERQKGSPGRFGP